MNFDYSSSHNLRVRRNLYDRFSTREKSWNSWLIAGLMGDSEVRSILDVGGGYGSVWWDVGSRCRATIVITDISHSMVRDAPANQLRAVMDAEALAIRSSAFDVVTAFNVLYHISNRTAAFREITRVLKRNGRFVFTTTGTRHLQELRDLVHRHTGIYSTGLVADSFPIEQAHNEAVNCFSNISVEVFPERLIVTDAEAIVDYIRTTPISRLIDSEQFDSIRQELQVRCSQGNGFEIRTEAAKLTCGNV